MLHRPEKSVLGSPALRQPERNDQDKHRTLFIPMEKEKKQNLYATNDSNRKALTMYLSQNAYLGLLSRSSLVTKEQYNLTVRLEPEDIVRLHIVPHLFYFTHDKLWLGENHSSGYKQRSLALKDVNETQNVFTWNAAFSSVWVLSVLSCDLFNLQQSSDRRKTGKHVVISQSSVGAKCFTSWQQVSRSSVMLANYWAHLCDSGRGNMPGHVSSLGRTGPKKLWDTPSFAREKNSYSSLSVVLPEINSKPFKI